MGLPVKLSDDLVKVARREAAAADRSMTAQIEHWATLGRSVEAALRHDELLAFKASQGNLANAFPHAATRDSVHRLLREIARTTDRSELARTIRLGRTVYESDGSSAIVRIRPDDTRTPGRFEHRRFVPATSGGRRPRR